MKLRDILENNFDKTYIIDINDTPIGEPDTYAEFMSIECGIDINHRYFLNKELFDKEVSYIINYKDGIGVCLIDMEE